MKSITEMRTWNFQRALKFFSPNAKGELPYEASVYMSEAKHGAVYDYRKESMNLGILDRWMQAPTLFFIDGASASGKTTLARKLAARYNIKVVDCDELCVNWIQKKIEKMTLNQRFAFLMDYDRLTDDYLEKNTESEVLKAAGGGRKSVILVGAYIAPIYRAIVGETIGSHFKNVIGIIMQENSLDELIKNNRARIQKMHFEENPMLTMKMSQQYQEIARAIANGHAWIFGTGTTETYITNKGAISE